MSVEQIDLIFPFFVLTYGAVVTIALNIPSSSVDLVESLRAHRHLAFACLVIGALWSLQNLLID
jgi:hypothetical protein